MAKRATSLIWILLALICKTPAHADTLEFVSRELFTIPFGHQKVELGSKIEKGQFLIPRDFSIDSSAGHFYVNDALKHRIVRYSDKGVYQMSLEYPSTAHQVFAQPDGAGHLWLLISDPLRGFYYGIHDNKGNRKREGVFMQYNRFRLHVDDARVLHIILWHTKKPDALHTYILDQDTFLLKKINVAVPPAEHHHLQRMERSYYIDPVPTGASKDAEHESRITDASRDTVGTLKGRVVYVTDQGEIYTRVGDCKFNFYSVGGVSLGSVELKAHPAACAGVRFDPDGNIYLLDGMPDANGKYSEQMPGMRLLMWERSK